MRLAPSVLNAKPIAQCTDADLKQVMSIARCHASRKGRPELSDDFASALLEDIVTQGHLRYNLNWRWSQFLRDSLGNLKNRKGRAKAYARTKPVDIDKVAHRIAEVDKPNPDESDPVNRIASHFKDRHRAFLILFFKWGLTEREIGHVFGITASRANQIMQDIKDTIQAKRLILPTPKRNHDN